MTISNSNRTAGPYPGNGVTTVFPFNFKVFSRAEVVALRSDGITENTLVLDSDYSVLLNTDQDAAPGGSVTMLGAPMSAMFKLTLTSKVAELQGTSLTNQGGFYPKVIEAAFDRCVILIQQLRTITSRSLRFPLSDTGVNTELPVRGARANNLLGFDENGNPVTVAPTAQSATALQLALLGVNGVNLVGNAADKRVLAGMGGASGIGYQPPGEGAAESTVADQLNKLSVHVKDFGALTGGFADATAAINKAILAAQKLKDNQLSYDEIYSVDVLFEPGKDYKIVGPVFVPSGIVLRGQGCRAIGNNPGAGAVAYNDAAPSCFESGYYDGATITTNRFTGLNTQRLVGSGITGFAFTNMNCPINVIQMNERSFIEKNTVSNCSTGMRLKRCYYLEVDQVRITGSALAVNQYAVLLHDGNHNAMTLKRITCGAGASVGLSVSGPASSGVTVTQCTFEESTGTGIYFAPDAYCLGWNISNNYFEGIRYAMVVADGGGLYGVGIDNNFFSSCEYAVQAAPNSIRVASFEGNAAADGGGVIRNLVDFSAKGNDVRYQLQAKSSNTTNGMVAFLSNIIASDVSTAETTSVWTDIGAPFAAIGKSQPGLANQNALNELPFEGANIVSKPNQVPFCNVSRAVDTLTIDTAIKYDLSNVLAFNFYGGTDAVAFDLKGFIFGTTVQWVTHTPVGVAMSVTDNGGNVRIRFTSLTAAVPVINVSGMVRHV